MSKNSNPATPFTIPEHAPSAVRYLPKRAEEFHEHLLTLPFDAYARLLALLLERLGYEQVSLAGRNDWKGRNHSGGVDLTAILPGGLTPRRVVIQIKQFDATARVFQRHIDELCGVAIRSRASEAILITTGPVSSSVHLDQLVSPLLPIRLIDGKALLALLVEHCVGVTADGEIDQALLSRLIRSARGNSRIDCPGRPEVLVNVEILARTKQRQITLKRASLLTPA